MKAIRWDDPWLATEVGLSTSNCEFFQVCLAITMRLQFDSWTLLFWKCWPLQQGFSKCQADDKEEWRTGEATHETLQLCQSLFIVMNKSICLIGCMESLIHWPLHLDGYYAWALKMTVHGGKCKKDIITAETHRITSKHIEEFWTFWSDYSDWTTFGLMTLPALPSERLQTCLMSLTRWNLEHALR